MSIREKEVRQEMEARGQQAAQTPAADGRRRILAASVREEVYGALDFSRETSDEEMYALIDAKIAALSLKHRATLSERRRLRREVFSAIRELDVLQPLLDDPAVTDVKMEA